MDERSAIRSTLTPGALDALTTRLERKLRAWLAGQFPDGFAERELAADLINDVVNELRANGL